MQKLVRQPPRSRMPIELRNELASHPTLKRQFEALPPSHQKRYTEYVSDSPLAEVRASRAKEAARMLDAKLSPEARRRAAKRR